MIDSEVMLLPQPDSPTMPSVSPLRTDRLMPSTARTVPAALTNSVHNPDTSSSSVIFSPPLRLSLRVFLHTQVFKRSQGINLGALNDLPDWCFFIEIMNGGQLGRSVLQHRNVMCPEMARIAGCPLKHTVSLFSAHFANALNEIADDRLPPGRSSSHFPESRSP